MRTIGYDEFNKIINELKNEQKKKFRRFVVFVVILCLILSGITGVASYTYAANNVGYTPRDTTWNVENTEQAINELRESVGTALVGSIFSYMGNYVPVGYLACDGSEYNIADYPRLASHISYNFGSYNYFGGDGETTFAVPDLRGEFLRGNGKTGADVGVHQADGLPNITGYQNTWVDIGRGDGVGALYRVDDGTDYVGTGTTGGTRYNRLAFDASRSNKIYGAATEVRPKNTSVLFIIKY